MKKIGIVDVTTIGSTICQRRICELGGVDGNHPEFIVHSLPFSGYKQAVLSCDWKKTAQLLNSSIKFLEKAGADFVIIPANTPHYAYQDCLDHVSIPVINLLEIVAKRCKQLHLGRVLVLGTSLTTKYGLYNALLMQNNIHAVYLSESDNELVHQFIMQELIPGKVTSRTSGLVLEKIQQVECNGVILGCTELPEVYNEGLVGKICVDTTRLLADFAFNTATDAF